MLLINLLLIPLELCAICTISIINAYKSFKLGIIRFYTGGNITIPTNKWPVGDWGDLDIDDLIEIWSKLPLGSTYLFFILLSLILLKLYRLIGPTPRVNIQLTKVILNSQVYWAIQDSLDLTGCYWLRLLYYRNSNITTVKTAVNGVCRTFLVFTRETTILSGHRLPYLHYNSASTTINSINIPILYKVYISPPNYLVHTFLYNNLGLEIHVQNSIILPDMFRYKLLVAGVISTPIQIL